MAKPRAVVVETWDGPVTVQRLAAADPEPTPVELAQLATDWTPAAGGVRPTVRVLERGPALRARGVGGAIGPAGSIPRR
jgi:hypothetical protein